MAHFHFSNISNDSSDDPPVVTNPLTLISPVCMSICCLFGVYGNAVSALIYMHPIMKSPIDVLLTGLSFIDFSLVILAIPVFVFPSLNMAINSPFLQSIYPFTALIVYPFSLMAQTCSIWTFVLVSVERYLAICQPLKTYKLLTRREAKLAQITVVALSFSYNIVRFWEYKPIEEYPNFDVLLRYDKMYFYVYYTSLYQITHFVIPFLAILFLNLFIIRSLIKTPDNLRRFSRSQIQQRKTAGMMVIITTMFALCNLGPFIMNIWEAVDFDLFVGPLAIVAHISSDISNCMVVVNSATTFIIYLLCCRKYRLLFRYYGRLRRPVGSGRYLLDEDNNVHCALVQAAFPLRAPVLSHNFNTKQSFSIEMAHRSDSTRTYSSAKTEN